ncbi:proteoglycan 4-like [Ylistrum balloti]|uniref:proteoglycan 4-like n=1 Tax=Ylistrum balloti TaxID=509963 RepID=UPI002905EEE5|nr:proteoglycan 4-like [Ylistrum balloti]
MTGMVEVASIPPWKLNIMENGRVFDDSGEPGGHSNDKYNNINDIPTWKRSFVNPDTNNSKPRDNVRSSSSSSVDIRSSHVNNNIPYTSAEGNRVKVKFSLGGDTTEVSDMKEDRETSTSEKQPTLNSKVAIDNTHLKHVQSNPFFVELGGVTHPHGKLINDSLPESPQLSRSDSVSTCTTEDEVNDYSPHSGIVEKLRKKFTSLSSHEKTLQGAASRLKRYGSLDNLLGRGSLQSEISEPVKSPSQKSYLRNNSQTDVSKSSRSRADGKRNSLECKSFRDNRDGTTDTVTPALQKPPKIISSKTQVTRNDSSSSVEEQKSPKPPVPEMQISSDDIIIIEQPCKSSASPKSADNQDVKTLKSENEEGELPKPNTVSTFRTLFEANTKVSRRKILPDAPRSPMFISASTPKPPVSRSKPQVPQREKLPAVDKMTSKAETQSSQETDSDDKSPVPPPTSKVTPSIPSLSPSGSPSEQTVAKVTVSSSQTQDSFSDNHTVASMPMHDKPNENDAVMEKPASVSKDKQSTDNIEIVSSIASKPPRAFDSPVTKKKNIGEMKSIFDSNIIAASGPKPIPVLKPRKTVPKNVTRVTVEKAKELDTSTSRPNGISVQNSVVSDTKMENNETKANLDFPKKKSVAPVPPQIELHQKPKIPVERKQIFDSASIVPVSSSDQDSQNQTEKKRAPPRPKAMARKLSRSNSVEEDPNKASDKEVIIVAEKSVPKESQTPAATKPEKEMKQVVQAELPPKSDVPPILNRFSPVIHSSKSDDNNKLKTSEQDDRNKSSLASNAGSTPATKTSNFEPVGVLNQKNEELNSASGRPTKGIPTIIANRFLKDRKDVSQENKNNDKDDSDDETNHSLVKPSQFRAKGLMNGAISSPVPKKRGQSSEETALDKTRKNVIAKKNNTGSSNIDDLIRGKKNSPSAVFNSNMIPAKPVSTTSAANNGVPPLDLTLIEEKKNHPYQEGYIPTKIEPCKIKFIGAGMKGPTQPLAKTRKTKLKISFNDQATATHEYQSENAALHDYLVIHPKEEEEVKKEAEEEKPVIKLEDFEYADESSDDVAETPRSGGPGDSSIRSNTPLSGAGTFGGYKSKMSVDFEFGMSMVEEPPVASPDPDPVEDSEETDILPIADDDTFNWTDNSSADLLF